MYLATSEQMAITVGAGSHDFYCWQLLQAFSPESLLLLLLCHKFGACSHPVKISGCTLCMMDAQWPHTTRFQSVGLHNAVFLPMNQDI